MNIKEIKSKLYDPNYKYFNLNGRIGKEEFLQKYAMPLFAVLIAFFAIMIVGTVLSIICGLISETLLGIVSIVLGLIYLVAMIPMAVVGIASLFGQVRRFHDLGMTGWIVLIINLVGLGIVSLIMSIVMDGKPEANKYGEPVSK